MYYILLLSIMISALSSDVSSMQISHQECLKAKYGHTLGGTLHSRKVLKNRLLRKNEAALPLSREESLKKLQKRYPALNIRQITFVIKNCAAYYRAKCGKKICYFDPVTLQILSQTGEAK
jgi:hypothetical protein